MKTKQLAISLGDTRGVGPEITLKALALEFAKADGWSYRIYGNRLLLQQLNERLQIGCPLEKILILEGEQPLSQSPALNAVHWLSEAAKACLEAQVDGMITAPVSKEEIIRAGYEDFVGQTEFLSHLAGVDDTVMMLLGADKENHWLRIALTTTHLRLSRVAEALTQAKVENAIRKASTACQLLKTSRARVGVSGLNPHSGEGGKMGDEEQRVITPAIEQCLREGINVVGPIAADALLRKAWVGELDAIVSMYHDQALPALKMVAFDSGINWTLGLPFIRVSPDHGTAFDIAGKGIASPLSMQAAITLAKQLANASSPR